MRSVRSIATTIGMIIPIVYCVGLLVYFSNTSGWLDSFGGDVGTRGLGPTMLGLGAIGLLFSIPLLLRIVRAVTRPRTAAEPVAEEAFDADAALARYLARKQAGGELPQETGGRGGFGRKGL